MKRQKKGSLRRREIRTGYLMIAPLMAGVIVFFIGAFFRTFITALQTSPVLEYQSLWGWKIM
ncbi:MAG: hypothetical protein ACLRMZ_16465 [Blautia marasmi]